MILNELFLIEAKLYDFRHHNIEKQLPYWGGKTSGWIDPAEGFYWAYVKGKLKIFSTENDIYSFVASDPKKVQEKIVQGEGNAGRRLGDILIKYKEEDFSSYNHLGGLVNYANKTITITKESIDNKMRH